MTVCIQYSRPQSSTDPTVIYGLDVAINNLLTAYFCYSKQGHFYCRPNDLPSFEHFKTLAKNVGHNPDEKCTGLDPHRPRHTLGNISCMFRADPLITDLMWRRHQLQDGDFATCGLVHTMSGERIAHAVNEFCLAPSSAADALICPSPAIRDTVQSLWAIYTQYLNHHFGANYTCPVQTPVIPLGIDTEKFARLTTADKRKAERAALGADDDEVIILFLGRLSFATKAHPLPLWLAAQKAAEHAKRKVRVVMFGYFKPKDMEPHFRNLAADIAKYAPIEFIMNDDPRFPDGLWAGADIFTSLSDNIQESFGLTPIEAMAAGLPVVASDWDGYRGSVNDGEDGFLIPTITPPAHSGHALAEAYFNQENYGVSLMGAAQSTAIDIERAAAALYLLITDDNRRKAMGACGQQHAQSTFDWRHIIPAYEALWEILGEKRKAMPNAREIPTAWPAAHPSYPNPFVMFGSFPSTHLVAGDRIAVVMDAADCALILSHEMNYFLPEFLFPKETLRELVDAIRNAGHATVGDILAPFPSDRHEALLRCIGWMLKHGIAVVRRDV